MSIKRLKHHAQNLCQMFCGWELMFDYKQLADMESGALQINVLTGECFHNGKAIKPLKIVSGLKNWMEGDLTDNSLNIGQIECAELIVQFQTDRHLGQKITPPTSWADPTPYYVSCILECSSTIRTSEREFTSYFSDVEEWPESYSKWK
jgi:hypothetical protein